MRVCPHCRLIFQNSAFQQCDLHGAPLEDRQEDPLIGTALDRYQILTLLGAGAMGRVYTAKHAVLGRIVAIKVLYGDYACEESFRLRFEREAQAVGRMRHPNVVSVTDFGSVEGLPFLVMDYLEGDTLDRTIDAQAPFSPARAAAIARQIASGLDEAHHHGFIHRDMKPSNVVISGTPPNETAKILDFGVVSMIHATEEGASRLTTEGEVVGTPMYMSPEQTMDPNVGQSSDLYSLGVILYEMLSGRPPFIYEGRMAMMLAHLHELPAPLPDCGGLEALAMHLLEKDPSNRPSSAKEVVAELDRLRELGFSDRPLVGEQTGDLSDPAEKRRLTAFNTFPALHPPTLEIRRAEGLPTIELAEPSLEVRRQWSSASKAPAQELIPVLAMEANREISIEIERRMDDHLFRLHHASRLDAGLKILEHETIAAIVLDLTLPDCDGLETLDRVRERAKETPIVVVSKLGHEWLAIEAIRRGADDYLTCSFEDLHRLQRSVRFAIERRSRKVPAPSPREPQPPSPPAREPSSSRGWVTSIALLMVVFAVGLLAGVVIPALNSP